MLKGKGMHDVGINFGSLTSIAFSGGPIVEPSPQGVQGARLVPLRLPLLPRPGRVSTAEYGELAEGAVVCRGAILPRSSRKY